MLFRVYCRKNGFASRSHCTRNKISAARVSTLLSKNALASMGNRRLARPNGQLSRKNFNALFSAKSFFPDIRHIQTGRLLRNTPTDLYLLIARLALYEPARESRSINAAKNNSPLPGEGGKERVNMRVVRGQRRFTGIVVLVLLYTLIEHITSSRRKGHHTV